MNTEIKWEIRFENGDKLPFIPLNKANVVREIRSKSARLRDYFNNIPIVIRNNITYMRKRIPEGYSYKMQNGTNQNGNHIVVFDSNDIASANDAIIAHELNHILLKGESYPYFIPKVQNEYRIFSNLLNNILPHPLIYNNLRNLGFDVENGYNDIVFNDFKRYIGFPNNSWNNISDFEYKKLILYFADNYFIQKTLFNELIDDQPFNNFIRQNYSDISEEAEALIRFIVSNGYVTAEQHRALSINIVALYELKNYVRGYYISNSTAHEFEFD